MKVTVLMPTKGRAKQMRRNVMQLLLHPLPESVEVLTLVLAVIEGDVDTMQEAADLASLWMESDVTIQLVVRDPGSTCVNGFNMAYLSHRGLADWYVLGADDQVYQENWLQAALDVADATGAAVIGMNDGHTPLEQYAPHFMVSSQYIEIYQDGWMVPPVYQSWWFDREICERANLAGLYAPAWESMVEHCHPDWGTAEMDDTYQEAWPTHDKDFRLYLSRKNEVTT